MRRLSNEVSESWDDAHQTPWTGVRTLTVLVQEPVMKPFINAQDPHRDSNGSPANHQDPSALPLPLPDSLYKLTPNKLKRKATLGLLPVAFPGFWPLTVNTHVYSSLATALSAAW